MNNPTNGNRVIDTKMLIASRMLDAENVNTNRRYIRKLNKLSEKLSRKDNNLVVIYEPESVVSELKKTCTHERKTNLRAMRDDDKRKEDRRNSLSNGTCGHSRNYPTFNEQLFCSNSLFEIRRHKIIFRAKICSQM